MRSVLVAAVVWSVAAAAWGQAAEYEAPAPLQLSLYFGGGSAYVDAEERARLRNFLDGVPALANYGIELQGHTDDIGDRAYNLRLSAARTRAVEALLLDFPVPAGAIELLPLGEEAPAFDNGTWRGKLNNRRVDVVLRPML